MATAVNGRARHDEDTRRLLAEQERGVRAWAHPRAPSSEDAAEAYVWGTLDDDWVPPPHKGLVGRLRAGAEAVGDAASACLDALDRRLVGLCRMASQAFDRLKPWVFVSMVGGVGLVGIVRQLLSL